MRKFLISLLFVILLLNCVYAGTVSVSNPDYSSTGDVFKKQWLVTVVQDERTDIIAAKQFSKTALNDGGSTAGKDFKITMETTKRSCVYTTTNRGIPIYNLDYTVTTIYNPFNLADYANKCANEVDTYAYYAINTGYPYKLYCFKKNVQAYIGEFEPEVYDFSVNVKVSVDGQEKSTKVSGSGGTGGSVPGYLDAKWYGNLASGENCKVLFQTTTPIYDGDNGEWYFADNSNVNSYNSYSSISGYDCLKTARDTGNLKVKGSLTYLSNTDNDANYCKNQFNLAAASALNHVTRTIEGSNQERLNEPYSKQGSFIYNNMRPLQRPQITLKINADWIGIIEPKTNPVIVSATSSKFAAGSIGYIDVVVRNDGSDGSISAYTDCNAPFSKKIVPTSFTPIKSKETLTLRVPITVGTKTDICGICNVYVQDGSDSSIIRNAKASVCATSIKICTEEGKEQCYQNKIIQRCINGDWQDIKTCDKECKLGSTGKPECTSGGVGEICDNKVDDDSDGYIDCTDSDCKNVSVCKEGQISVLRLLLSILIGLALGIWAYVSIPIPNNTVKTIVAVVIGIIGFVLVAWIIKLIVDLFTTLFTW